jgi:hypothetical protein
LRTAAAKAHLENGTLKPELAAWMVIGVIRMAIELSAQYKQMLKQLPKAQHGTHSQLLTAASVVEW